MSAPRRAKAELDVGDRVASYQLVSPIGTGGMGRVWVALDTVAPGLRLVALKTALRDSGDREFWAVLSDEAALASRIQHPNVCATHEFGDASGTHYLVMEWSDGASLRDLLDALPNHRLEPVLAAHIVAAVAAGLHSAHELAGEDGLPLGVVHRDVSPQNVLLSLRGHVRLADFGVAKARGQAHRPTETGEVKGKLSYMSPEQVASKPIDRRSDVFGLGAVLYEIALGVRPFHGADALATMYKILEQELVPPRGVDPDFPEQLERVLLKALAKDAAQRYQSADEFRQDLLAFVASTRRLVTDKLTAELLESSLGPSLRARNAAILEAAKRLRTGETEQAKLRSPPPPPPQRSVTPEGGVERTISEHHVSQRGNKPKRVGAAVLTGVLAAAATALVFVARAPRTAASAPGPVQTTASSAASFPLVNEPAPPVSASTSPPPEPSENNGAPPPNPSTLSARHPRPQATPTAKAPANPIPTNPAKLPTKTPRPIDHSNPFLNP